MKQGGDNTLLKNKNGQVKRAQEDMQICNDVIHEFLNSSHLDNDFFPFTIIIVLN